MDKKKKEIKERKDVIYLHAKTKSELFEAKTVGKLIDSMEGLQRSIGKNMGYKVRVFIKSIEYTGSEVTIGYIIVQEVKEVAP